MLAKPGATVQWKKGTENLKAGNKYEIKQKDAGCELQIKHLKVEDSGEYSCECGDQRTTATIKVNGMGTCSWSMGMLGRSCLQGLSQS